MSSKLDRLFFALLVSLPACSTPTSSDHEQTEDALTEPWTPTIRTVQRGNTVDITWDPQGESPPGTWRAHFFWRMAILEYGTTSEYGETIWVTPGYGTNAPATTTLTDLAMGASYHYRIKFFREFATDESALVWTSPDATFTVVGTLIDKTITGNFHLTAQGSPYWFLIPDTPTYSDRGFLESRPSDACLHGTMTAEPGAVIDGSAIFTADCGLELHGTAAAPVSIRGSLRADTHAYDDEVNVSLRHVDASEGFVSIRARGCELEDSILDRGELVLDACDVRNNGFLPRKRSDGNPRLLRLRGSGVFTNNWVGERSLDIQSGAQTLSGNAFVLESVYLSSGPDNIDLRGNYWGLDCRPLVESEPCSRIEEKFDLSQGSSVTYLPYLQDAPTGLLAP